jgi:hypothetical protein
LGARHGAGPHALARQVGNFRQHGVVAVAFDDRSLEVCVNRRFRRGEADTMPCSPLWE